jgi:hypothetical protein
VSISIIWAISETHIFISQGGGIALGWQSCSLFAGFRDLVGFWVIFGWFYW